MTGTATLELSDLSQSRQLRVELGDDVTVDHDVDQVIEHFLEQSGLPRNDLEWSAYSRGVRLDKRARLGDLTDEDVSWTVLPTVTAGAG
jgi:hypothetical protein